MGKFTSEIDHSNQRCAGPSLPALQVAVRRQSLGLSISNGNKEVVPTNTCVKINTLHRKNRSIALSIVEALEGKSDSTTTDGFFALIGRGRSYSRDVSDCWFGSCEVTR